VIYKYADIWHGAIAGDPKKPFGLKHDWALIRVDKWKAFGENGAGIDPDIILLPAKTLDASLDLEASALSTKLSNWGITKVALSSSTKVEEAVRQLGREHSDDFEVSNLGPQRDRHGYSIH
jgi:hypothetical protein